MHNEIQDVLGQSFGLPEDLDEDDLMGELDALDDEMAQELDVGGRAGIPSYLQVLSFPHHYYEMMSLKESKDQIKNCCSGISCKPGYSGLAYLLQSYPPG